MTNWPPNWRIAVRDNGPAVFEPDPSGHGQRWVSGGSDMLSNYLAASYAWSELTERQRELVLSTAAGYPIAVRADVTRRLVARGFLDPDDPHKLTEAGRAVVRLRP